MRNAAISSMSLHELKPTSAPCARVGFAISDVTKRGHALGDVVTKSAGT